MKPIVFTIILIITILLQSERACSMWTLNVNIDLISGRHSPPLYQGWVPTCSAKALWRHTGHQRKTARDHASSGFAISILEFLSALGLLDKSISSLNCHRQAQYLCPLHQRPFPFLPTCVIGSENKLCFNLTTITTKKNQHQQSPLHPSNSMPR